jgi:hypothetical protein
LEWKVLRCSKGAPEDVAEVGELGEEAVEVGAQQCQRMGLKSHLIQKYHLIQHIAAVEKTFSRQNVWKLFGFAAGWTAALRK